jgi:enediyne biosynthesis protein E4
VTHLQKASSCFAASDPRIHFGLGKRTKVESLEITWPGGQMDRLTKVPIDQIIAAEEGVGIVARRFPKFVGPK